MSTDPSVTTTRTIRFDTGDFRNALDAVLPHSKKNTTGDDAVEHRIRLVVDQPPSQRLDADGFDADTWLRLCATNGVTTAVALVAVTQDDATEGLNRHDGPYIFDLKPDDGRLLLQTFPLGRGENAAEQTLELLVRVDDAKFTDVSGLGIPGRSLLVPQLPFAENFPDVTGVAERALSLAAGEAGIARALVGDGNLLALFKKAGEAYEDLLLFEPLGGERAAGHLVTCGTRFVGTVKGDDGGEGALSRRAASRATLLRRFGILPRQTVDA